MAKSGRHCGSGSCGADGPCRHAEGAGAARGVRKGCRSHRHEPTRHGASAFLGTPRLGSWLARNTAGYGPHRTGNVSPCWRLGQLQRGWHRLAGAGLGDRAPRPYGPRSVSSRLCRPRDRGRSQSWHDCCRCSPPGHLGAWTSGGGGRLASPDLGSASPSIPPHARDIAHGADHVRNSPSAGHPDLNVVAANEGIGPSEPKP